MVSAKEVGVLVVVVFASLFATACSADPVAPEAFDATSFYVQSPSGEIEQVDGLDAVQDEIPFEIVAPELPDGAMITNVTAVLPPVAGDAAVRRRTTSVRMFAAAPDGRGLFQLDASLAGTAPGGGAVESVRVGRSTASLVDDGDSAALGWRSCDVGYLLAYAPSSLSRTDAIAIAEAIDEAC